MVYFKRSLAGLFVFIVTWGLYLWFSSSPERHVHLAVEEFNKGNYEAASKIIHKSEKDLPKAEYHLYLAYINREKSSLLESSEELKKAEQPAQTEPASKVSLEIYLNQALNAYLTRTPESMTLPLEKANKITDNNQWVNFFQALQDYLNGNYKTFLDDWKKPPDSDFLSPWMKKTFTDTFDSFWYSTHLAQANMALGNYLAARQELEKESKAAEQSRLDEIYLLLGLSYIKEAQEKPFIASTPYYKLAYSYLKRVPILNSRFTPYRIQILAIVHNQIKALISSQSLQDLSFYAGILENWQDKSGLQQMQGELIELIDQKAKDKRWGGINDILKTLNLHLKPEQHDQVIKKLNVLFDSALLDEDLPSMNKLWEFIRSFSHDPQEAAKTIADKLGAFIIQAIPIDTFNLFLTIPYLEFWVSLENTSSSRYGIAAILFSLAESLWVENRHPEKALMLAKTSMNIPFAQDQSQFKQHVSARLTYLYNQSLIENNASLLHITLKAMRDLNIPFNAKQDQINIINTLKEAKFFLDNENYLKAKEKSAWVLELEPDNQEALRIAGLADYYRANYFQANSYLSKVKHPEANVSEALSIIEIITEKKTIPQLIKNQLIGNEMYERLGFGFLFNGKPKEAIEWLSKISPATPEIHAGKSYAYWQLGDWNKSIEEYNTLPSAYKETLKMKGIALDSTAGLGNMTKAETMLQEILNSKPQTFDVIPSNSFNYLNANFFDNENPNYIAGMYYKTWKNDGNKALSYLKKINNPSSIVLTAIGDTLFLQGKYLEARKVLQKALLEESEAPLHTPKLRNVLLLLAMTNKHLNYFIESAKNFSDYFDALPNEILYRNEFAKVLMNLRRFDDAAKQLRLFRQEHEFSGAEIIDFITCLIHLDHFNTANGQALEYLLVNTPVSLAEQINIAKLMLITGDLKLIQAILNQVPEEKYWSLEVKIALIDLWMAQGNYETASKHIKPLQSVLEKKVKGLMLLARFYADAVDVNSAVQFANTALLLDPYNTEAVIFINKYKPDLGSLQLKLKEDPGNFSLQIEYAQQLILKASTLNQNGAFVKTDYDLNSIKHTLKELYQPLQDLPELHYLLGKVLFLQTDMEQAKIALNESIQLDRSYSDAYLYLSRIDLSYGAFDQALDKINRALHFQPNDSGLWVDKSDLFQHNNNVFDAMFCLEKAIRYKPLNIQAYLKLGVIQLNSENPEDAKKSFETALKIEPDNVQALKYLFMTLHHPFLSFSFKNKDKLKDEQQLIYDKLHQLNPKLAEETLLRVQEIP